MEVEQLLVSIEDNQLKIQILESRMGRLKNDREEEVKNNKKLDNALTVSKNLVDNLDTNYVEAMEQQECQNIC